MKTSRSFARIISLCLAVINENTVLIKGPLYGEFLWNGVEYDFIIGFTKLEGSDAASYGLTIIFKG